MHRLTRQRTVFRRAAILIGLCLTGLLGEVGAATLYQVDTNDRSASPSGYLDVSAYAATTAGFWRLIDGQTYENRFGFATPIVGLPDGVSLESISSSTSSVFYAHGNDGVLYYVDTNDRSASPSSYLDVSAYAATTGGFWRLIDGQTYENRFGFATPIIGLPDGVSLESISSSTSTTIYAFAIPEPSTWALLLVGATGVSLWRRKMLRRG